MLNVDENLNRHGNNRRIFYAVSYRRKTTRRFPLLEHTFLPGPHSLYPWPLAWPGYREHGDPRMTFHILSPNQGATTP